MNKTNRKWKNVFGEAAYEVIKFGIPIQDNIIIQRHQIDSMNNIPVLLNKPVNTYNIKRSEIAGTAKIFFLNKGVYAAINARLGERGNLLKKSLSLGIDIIPFGTGGVDENAYVWDYRLLYLYLNSSNKK